MPRKSHDRRRRPLQPSPLSAGVDAAGGVVVTYPERDKVANARGGPPGSALFRSGDWAGNDPCPPSGPDDREQQPAIKDATIGSCRRTFEDTRERRGPAFTGAVDRGAYRGSRMPPRVLVAWFW